MLGARWSAVEYKIRRGARALNPRIVGLVGPHSLIIFTVIHKYSTVPLGEETTPA